MRGFSAMYNRREQKPELNRPKPNKADRKKYKKRERPKVIYKFSDLKKVKL